MYRGPYTVPGQDLFEQRPKPRRPEWRRHNSDNQALEIDGNERTGFRLREGFTKNHSHLRFVAQGLAFGEDSLVDACKALLKVDVLNPAEFNRRIANRGSQSFCSCLDHDARGRRRAIESPECFRFAVVRVPAADEKAITVLFSARGEVSKQAGCLSLHVFFGWQHDLTGYRSNRIAKELKIVRVP